ncbi:MAG: TlpA disulfide reductase family protein [Nitrososphaerota archaeon]
MSRNKPKKRSSLRSILPVIPAAALVILIVFLVASPPQQPATTATATTATQGAQAPDFTLRMIDANGLTQQIFTLSSVRGRVLFIDFIHEWCVHCNNMADTIDQLHKKYRDNVFFLTVAGSSNTNPEKTADYLRRHGVSWTAVYDDGLEVFRRFGVRGTPTYFVVSSSGVILAKLEGEQPYATLEQLIQSALAS